MLRERSSDTFDASIAVGSYRAVMFKDRLRQAREAAALTQQAIADQLGARGLPTTAAAVTQWESGATKPGFEKVPALIHILRTDGHWLLTGDKFERDPVSGHDAVHVDTMRAAVEAVASYLYERGLAISAKEQAEAVAELCWWHREEVGGEAPLTPKQARQVLPIILRRHRM